MMEAVLEHMAASYPDLAAQRQLVTRVAGAEEADFGHRLRQGLDKLDQAIGRVRADATLDRFPGDVAFELHDTFGFPIDLTVEIAADAGLELDRDRFDALMDEQRRGPGRRPRRAVTASRSRSTARRRRTVGTTEFVGYDGLAAEAELGAIVTAGGLQRSAEEGDLVEVVLPRTPFYAEGGGQIGDAGACWRHRPAASRCSTPRRPSRA
jgi:alanyl-tRNA synthetase